MALPKGLKKAVWIAGFGAAGAVVFLSPEFNNGVEHLLAGSDAPTIGGSLNEEMTNAATGKGFDTGRFTTETGYFKTVVGARDAMSHNTAFFPDRKTTAAVTCGLLAVNHHTIPDTALQKWTAANTAAAAAAETETGHKAFAESQADQLFSQIATLCLNAYPPLNAPGTPLSRQVQQPVEIVNNAIS